MQSVVLPEQITSDNQRLEEVRRRLAVLTVLMCDEVEFLLEDSVKGCFLLYGLVVCASSPASRVNMVWPVSANVSNQDQNGPFSGNTESRESGSFKQVPGGLAGKRWNTILRG